MSAQVEWDEVRKPSGLVVLTHGSGGGVDAKDLLVVRDIALDVGASVARVTQPYRVAGRRAPGSPVTQDAAWLEVISELRDHVGPKVPLIQGGRSNGARVACRTAVAAGAVGVIALSFPLHPPGKPEKTRVDELRAAPAVVVINGSRDPFGVPDSADALEVITIDGQPHSFRAGFPDIASAARRWLTTWCA